MSLTLTKPVVRAAGAALGGPALPQVNLLPPEVKAARGLVNTKRWLAVTIGVVLVLIALVYVFAILARSTAENELATEQDQTTRLQAEVSKYAEVPQVLSNLDRTEAALTLGTSTEIMWKGYLDAIAAVLPPNVSIDTFNVSQATPWTAAQPVQDFLAAPSVGIITFTARTSTLPDNAAWLDALATIPNLSNPTFSAAAVTAQDGEPYYTVSASVQVQSGAFALRFPQTTPEG
ncbi:fimbrial assembly protein [Cellulomonas humilata]|uniref:Fimbrial assembly protein n=1 Tax=Cellulomonas humilata TaxID=144055 RepID=A0A7Y6A376_9CELL|nr:fimbrial assembly protein [Cellulomonas humilata]NUU17659.1 fimbrial assembly protein [Cellulomonas humilata]